jgi:hypothetical protein
MRNLIGSVTALVALVYAAGAGAAPMPKDDYKAAKKRIAAEYQAERQKCGPLYGHAADLCIAHAHGTRDVANAELQAAYKPGPRTDYDAAIARAKAAYVNAKVECDEQRGPAKKACQADAKKALEAARAEAKARSRAEDAAKAPSGGAR